MAISSSDLKVYKSTTVSDASANGGRLSSNQSLTGVAGNLFPSVTPAERTAGSTKYRKMYFKVANDSDLTLTNAQLWVSGNTPGADRITFFAATQRDTQASITGSERKYGAGALQTSALAGETSIVVTVEDGSTIVFVNGDTIRISDKANLADTGGNEEFIEISGTPSVVGSNVTITLATALASNYASVDTVVSSVYEPGDVAASVSNFSVTSGAGSYNDTTNPVAIDAIGTIEQTWTLTFTSTTAYTISGDTVGSVGTGNVSGGAAPSNAAFAKPYFTLAAGGFSGTWAIGNTITFQTHPAALPVWFRRVVPAASAVQANNTSVYIFQGETE